MDLDKLQIGANVRSGWQALDLGFLMARAWWSTLLLSAVLPALIVFIPLSIIFFDKPFVALFIIWWLKPFWERLPLYFSSRRIFGEQITLYAVLAKIRSIYFNEMLAWLLWRRLSFLRAFTAPVTVLEGLKGKLRKQRLGVLQGKNIDIAISNQLICFMFELIVCFGLFSGLLFFIPDNFGIEIYDSAAKLTLLGKWLYTLCAFIAIFAVMPFYSMAGFALYLNRRIELEAWDIEITFRNLVARKQRRTESLNGLMMVALLLTLLLSGVPCSSYAVEQYDRQTASESINEILKGEDFGREVDVEKWRFKNVVEENKDKIPQWIIDLVDWFIANFDWSTDSDHEDRLFSPAAWIKIILIVLFIVLLGYLLYRYRGPLKSLKPVKRSVDKPEIMFGLDVTPQSLPDDVPTQVMQLWNSNQQRESLGLLYRAALSHLIEHYELTFKPSHTEAECAALVKKQSTLSLSQYFEQITAAWCYLAYGHRLPATELIETLCKTWSREMSDALD